MTTNSPDKPQPAHPRPGDQRARESPPEPAAPWSIPTSAFTRPLGDYPLAATGSLPPLETGTGPECRTKRGIPVGGIGTGSFMYNLCGSFGPFELAIGGDDSPGCSWGREDASGHEERFLSGAAFHLRTRIPGSDPEAVTLATEDTLPAWSPLSKGQGTYHALFPKAWLTYDSLPVDLSMEQLSPYVARDERWSSLPVGLFRIFIQNPGEQEIEASIMLTWPNAIYRRPTAYDYTRKGLHSLSELHTSYGRDVHLVRLQALSPENIPATQRSEWVIAVARDDRRDTASTCALWNCAGDGSDIMSAFRGAYTLPATLPGATDAPAGAVAISTTLLPGESRLWSFAIAFDFPVVEFRRPNGGTRWLKRYTEWFPGGLRGADIASEVLGRESELREAVDAWWAKVANDEDYPAWLRRAALNELYYDVFGGSFWEAGCLTKDKRYGARPGQHCSFVLESNVYRDCETIDVRHYECRHRLTLFPNMERDILLGWADFIMDEPEGRTPHDAGSPMNDPWFEPGQYLATFHGGKPLVLDWKDLPARFVQQAHAYWSYTGDDAFLQSVFPAAERTMAYLHRFDKDGDGIPEVRGQDTTYDTLGLRGATTLVATLVIGAEEALAEMAAALGNASAAAAHSALAEKARRHAEAKLWVEDGRYYRAALDGECARTVMADALSGQRFCEVHGLDDVLDPERMADHFEAVWRSNCLPQRHALAGVLNAAYPDGSLPENMQAAGVWPGGTWFVAAMCYRAGVRTGRPELCEAALHMGEGVSFALFEDESMAFWFGSPAIWYADGDPGTPTRYRSLQYQRNRSAWELLLEMKDPFPPPSGKGWRDMLASPGAGAGILSATEEALLEDVRQVVLADQPPHETVQAAELLLGERREDPS